MSRVARATIRLDALHHNLGVARQQIPDANVMAVLKADAYGHGLLPVAHELAAATDGYAVSCLEEALPLRLAGLMHRIILLEGFFDADEIPVFSARRLDAVIHQPWQIEALAEADIPAPIDCWLKVDTGMGRLGFSPDEAADALARLKSLPAVGTIRWMTHLASADEPDNPLTGVQTERFGAMVDGAHEASLPNSAATLRGLEPYGDWIRPGIMLYGASPFEDTSVHPPLQPVMTLEAALVSVKWLPAGHGVGYGGRFACPEAMPVGVISIGYGDGYPRHAPDGTPVLIAGQRCPLIGRVSMDMVMVDLRNVPQARVGDRAILWGSNPRATAVATACGTISYELFCRLTPRVERVYRRGATHGEG
ncbi:alanine racemase [Spiribacter vilamensis]|uniref:Alanine racemase n=1 Tax=Spiribacter vilamensis TaxID=531306 RepID=A0A4Q8D0Q7_9GAMM|nr:alanine racemase [Spiribacter vilamensis]RZU98941.1 alanine racemase [Spiribacter vilamensis]TVO62049.1 alanine racemase [Spiribacter vilamensis]